MPEAGLERFSLQGRVALVTGASSGLGVEIAHALAGAGATLLITARREAELAHLAAELGCTYVVADLRDPEGRARVITATVKEHGRIDVLVNNAGASRPGPAEEDDDASFRSDLELNLVAPYALARLAALQMLAQGSGSIINVASILGLVAGGQIPDAGYAASKGGLINLTRELASQWSARGVRVNAVAPGFFPSEMTADLLDTESGRRWVERRTASARPGRPGELGGAVVFLAGDASSYVTGHVLAVDGGWTAL